MAEGRRSTRPMVSDRTRFTKSDQEPFVGEKGKRNCNVDEVN
jgi:hypothetical protein